MMPETCKTVPCLTTALTGPILELERQILANQTKIESWFRAQWQEYPAPLYASVDLRNAGFKLSPVDTNLFPAGFNNLNPEFMPLCIQAMQQSLERLYPSCQKVLLIPESHTRNLFYLESLAVIQEMIINAGYECRVGSLIPEITSNQTIKLPSGKSVLLEKVIRDGDTVKVDGFKPCVIVLNNDLSAGIPDILQGLKQPVIPPFRSGWFERLKSTHFTYYNEFAEKFANLLGIDVWQINPAFASCDKIDFMTHEGEQCLYENVSLVYEKTLANYKERGIDRDPFVFVKAESGTYGMGIFIVKHPDEVKQLNRKVRTSMSKSKGGKAVTRVLIQEGVYTFETLGDDQAPAEPVIYMIGQYVVGGFYRVHTERDATENLNTPGMHFEPLAFDCPCNTPDILGQPNSYVNRFYAYGVIARLALLAAAKEIKEAA